MANGEYFSALVRLYHASFDRQSDSNGVGSWASQLANGKMTFGDVADAFMNSDEFLSLYGEDLSDEEFIKLLYKNVLGREADGDGLENWLKALENGTLRRDVLLGFSDSDEHVDKVELEYEDELLEAEQAELASTSSDDDSDDDLDDDSDDDSDDDLDDDSDDDLDDDSDDDSDNNSSERSHQSHSDDDSIELLYSAAFNRSADKEGLGSWISQLAQSEVTLEDIAEYFIASAEFQERYGSNVSDDDFVEALYENTLDRASDDAGKANWIGQIASGMSRGELLTAFSESDEHSDLVLTGTPTIDTTDTIL